MKLRTHLRLLGATALAVFAAACGDQEKNSAAPGLVGPRLEIGGNGSGIGNFVWHDLNANGIQDAGEPGIPGATISYTLPGGSTGSFLVNPDGTYFVNGPSGPYTICVALPAGFTSISPKSLGGDLELDSDGDGTAMNCANAILPPNTTRLDIDFGFYKTAALGDFVWYDVNGNGIQDAGELGIPNASVTLTGPSGPQSANTGLNGEYGFTNLMPGSYTVCVDTPLGYSGVSLALQGGNTAKDSNGQGSPNCADVVIASGDNNLTIDFGFTKSKAALGDFVWHDLNGDGIQDAGEPGIPGVTVNLTGPSGPASMVTDANGKYGFGNLEPGVYTVCTPVPAGYVRSAAGQGVDGTIDSNGAGVLPTNCYTVTLAAGETNPTIDFGFFKLGAIGDFVWFDANSNGIQDAGEPGIGGVNVQLTAPGNIVTNTTTNGSGGYLFSGLVPGVYKVCVNTPAGYTGPTDDMATSSTPFNDSNGTGTPNCDTKVLKSGEVDLTYDFGFVIARAALGDYVWFDKNANGIQDASETGISGATVTLTGPSGPLSTTTASDGLYAFSNLMPGSGYQVCVVAPAGYAGISPANTTADDKDSDGVGAGNCAPAVTLVAGENNTTLDFGFYTPVEIGNFVWHDLNANGIQDASEPGISGATVSMTGPSGPASTVTGANGEYSFTNLKPGTYSVCVVLPSGYTQYSPTAQGGDNAKDSNGPGNAANCSALIDVPSGTTDMNFDFGFYKLAAVGDFVWADANSDGKQTAGEVGIGSQTIKLSGPGGDRTAVTTPSGGIYGFTNLMPGSYTICAPATIVGYSGTSPSFQGGDATKDSNGSGGAANCASVTLTSGQTDLTIDFGYIKAAVILGSIGDFVWHDLNANGIQDAGEPGIVGATVTMTGPGGPYSTVTTAGGNYSFTGLAAGTYVVCVVKPAGYAGISGAGLGADVTKDSNGNGTAANCSANVVLAAGASNITIDFGFYKLASLGDYTWYDKNDNGIQNAGEAAFNGVTLTLSGTQSGTQTSASGGKYLFTNLKPGTYTVCATIPNGYHASASLQGADRDVDSNGAGATNCSAAVTLVSGETNLSVDFGFDCGRTTPTTASVGDFVWRDTDSDGVQDAGEDGIKGVTVKLTGNGVNKTTTTSTSGKYLFSDLQPGTYTICVGTVSGLFPTGADKGGNDAKDSDGTGTGNCATTTLSAGEEDLTIDFGFDCKPITAALQGYVWNDVDMDGIQDSNESGINGRTVTLTGPSGAKTTTTNSSGKYYFTNLPAGAYTVCTSVPTGSAASPANTTNDAVDSDGTGSSNCATVSLAAGESKVDPDFGMYCKPVSGAIGSYVWNDADKDGIQDNGESGISGRTVTLTGAASKTTTTDSYGKYAFTGLGAGTYTVCVGAPSGYTVSPADKGSDDNVDSDGKGTGNCATVTLTTGQTNNSLDFGFYCTPVPGAIGGQVWYDKDFDGKQDGGYEVGLSGQTVKLSGPGGDKTATTNSSGLYNFGSLAAGTYTICGVIPKDYKASPANQTNDTSDSDGSGSSNCTTFTLAAGQTINTIDFGFDKKW
ncbi:MAG: SdrD B-like domain-containing protein [Gemmatimonas sp.]